MLSRTADSLFWLSRYMERADGMLRILKIHYILSFDKGVNSNFTWRPLLEIFTKANNEKITVLENNDAAVLQHVVIDAENDNSLKVIITRARENARAVQDHITKEVWEQVNQMYHTINNSSVQEKLSGSGAIEVIDYFSRQTILYTGVTDITMPRGIGWSFMNMGKYVERCLETIIMTDKQYQLINYNLNTARDIIEWRYLLLSLSGYELHLKTYQTTNYNHNVLQQVLFNPQFPRSVIYSLGRIEKYLKDVVSQNNLADNQPLFRGLSRLYAQVKYVDADTLNNVALQQFLSSVKSELLNFSSMLGKSFFSY